MILSFYSDRGLLCKLFLLFSLGQRCILAMIFGLLLYSWPYAFNIQLVNNTNNHIPSIGLHTEADPHENYTDVFSCLSGSCRRTPPCESIRPSQSFALLCRHVLPKLLTSTDVQWSGLPSKAIAELTVCADRAQSDQRIHKAVQILKDTLQAFRPCNTYYGYRYPECRYSDKF